MRTHLLVFALWLVTSGHVKTATASNLCRDSCNIDFVSLGCYIDQPARVLPNYIYNERDPSLANYGGRSIDWFNWNEYFPGFACRCAQKAKEEGYDLFGLQFYGECWAGNSGTHNYKILGEDYAGCVQDDYQLCWSGTRYCVGKNWRNMVYQIVDTSCPDISFEKVGCFKDHHNILTRPLPEYLFNDRDDSIENFSGELIDWRNWDIYVPYFACRCAKAAMNQNYTFFGMQFYGECWSGAAAALTYYRNGLSGMRCIDQCNEPCSKYSKYCAGKHLANFVYRISSPTCEVDIQPVGCYREMSSNLAMKDIFYNEADPQKPNYAGRMLSWSDQYEVDFPVFLCKCARMALQRGWEYFGVRELGLCVRSTGKITRYAKHGASEQCFEQTSTSSCSVGSKLCRGLTAESNFVYQITLPVHGGYSDWGSWSDCSVTCGSGSRIRSRECNNPEPKNGGFNCEQLGPEEETEICTENACPEEELGSAEYLDDRLSLKDILRPRRQPRQSAFTGRTYKVG